MAGAAAMPDFLLHVYRRGSRPFQSLSALPEQEALRIMRGLYVQGSVFWERFGDPEGYLRARRESERILRAAFAEKGGEPLDAHPVYLVVGRPRWMQAAADSRTLETTQTIEVPLAAVRPDRISFTCPDSMVSLLVAAQGRPPWFDPEVHGKVFLLAEMRAIIARRGLPGEGWESAMPAHYANYVEAQVWDREALAARLPDRATGPSPLPGCGAGAG